MGRSREVQKAKLPDVLEAALYLRNRINIQLRLVAHESSTYLRA